MMNVKKMITDFYNDESGVTAVEYAIVIAGVAAVCLVIFGTNDDSPVNSMLSSVFEKLGKTLGNMVGDGATSTP